MAKLVISRLKGCLMSTLRFFSLKAKEGWEETAKKARKSRKREREKKGEMKLVWCPETASKAYIETVRMAAGGSEGERDLLSEESGVAELVSAMAGGWKAQTIVEAWAPGTEAAAMSLGLAAAARHTRGRHVCVVPDEHSREAYVEAIGEDNRTTEVIVGEAEEVMGRISSVDFVVVDWRRRDTAKVLRAARLGARGAVLVCLGGGGKGLSASGGGTRWRGMLMPGSRVVRTALLPIGAGVEVVHVGVGRGPSLGGNCSRWIRHVDSNTGEEHLFRR